MAKRHRAYGRTTVLLPALIGLFALLLGACQARPPHLSGGVPPALVQSNPQGEVALAAPEPTPASSPVEISLEQEDCQCIDCHSDADRLKELAVEPEAVEALSEGEG